MPTAFMSYSWDDDDHKTWVRELAARLRADGVNVILDQWETVPGDQLPVFMERSIRENAFVLVVCTPRYKAKSDSRTGGVGYEGDIMTAEVFSTTNHRKFIPIWRSGSWSEAAPTWLSGKYHVDLRGTSYSDEHYSDLVSTLHGTRALAPPLGKPFSTTPPSPATSLPQAPRPNDPITILGVVIDEVTQPKMDGTRGSALYAVPFRFSRKPDPLWSTLFVRNWDHPPRYTSMHRPGIATVIGDRVVLNGTTLDEIEKYHRDTLKLALEKTNAEFADIIAEQNRKAEAQSLKQEEHRRDVAEKASKLTFD